MSEIKVNSIKGVGASAAAITVNNTDGTCTANITNNLSNRNLIINGAMQVAQRGTSSTSTSYNTVDRMFYTHNGVDEAATTAQHALTSSDTGPYGAGFRHSFHITNGNQTSGIAADHVIVTRYLVEAQDIAKSGWNYTSSSSFITFSFWVKASVAQTYYVRLYAPDGTPQGYAFAVALSANTWTKITKKIPGNSNLQFDNNSDVGFTIEFNLYRGTDSTTSGYTLDTWADYSATSRVPDMTGTWYTTNDATFEYTGMQLEVGSVATDFEHRSFGQELQLCKRYFQNHAPVSGDHMMWGVGRAEGNTGRIGLPVSVPMRAAPTIYAAKNRLMRYDGTGSDSTDTPSVFAASTWLSESNIYTIDFGGHSLSHNNMYLLTSLTDSKITLSAEL